MPRAFNDDERYAITERLRLAGRKSIGEFGLRRLKVEDLTRAAGISKGAFYQFYPSKEALFFDIMTSVEAEARSELERRLQEPWQQPRELIARFLTFLFEVLARDPILNVLTNPEEAALLLRSVPPAEMAARAGDDDRYFSAIFAEWQQQGILEDGVDPEELCVLPRMALALVQQRELIGDRFEVVVKLLIDSLADKLAARSKG